LLYRLLRCRLCLRGRRGWLRFGLSGGNVRRLDGFFGIRILPRQNIAGVIIAGLRCLLGSELLFVFHHLLVIQLHLLLVFFILLAVAFLPLRIAPGGGRGIAGFQRSAFGQAVDFIIITGFIIKNHLSPILGQRGFGYE